MRTFVFVITAILIGVALGAGLAVWQVRSPAWDRTLDESSDSARAVRTITAKSGAAPRASVDESSHDFGRVVNGSECRHDFVVTNHGDAPLVLSEDGTSAEKGIALKFDRKEVAPRASATITATWTPNDRAGRSEHHVLLVTNDPTQQSMSLTLSAEIIDSVQLQPAELKLTGVSLSEAASGEAKLLNFESAPLKIVGHQWSNAATAKHFDVAVEPLTKSDLPKDSGAKSGFLVKVTAKAGLPPGRIEQSLILETNVSSLPTMTLPIVGNVANDIMIAGLGPEPDVVDLGNVRRSEGLKRTIVLLLRGPARRDIQLTVDKAQLAPKFLKVEIGKPRDINEGTVIEVPLTIEIPPGSPPAAYLGTLRGDIAQIVLHTTHPRLPKFTIKLRLAIEG